MRAPPTAAPARRPEVDMAAQGRVLRLLGLGVRGRLAVAGVDRVREAAQKGTLRLAVVAPDASPHSLDKVLPLLAAKRVTVLQGPSATELGAVVGREATAAIGVTDADLARGVRQAAGDVPAPRSGAGK